MGAWDAYIGNNATGDNTYFNQKFLHTKGHSRITAMAHIHMQYTRSFTMQLLADLPRMTILQLTGKALRAC